MDRQRTDARTSHAWPRGRSRGVASLVLAVLLIAAACGEGGSEATTAASADEAGAPASTTPPETSPPDAPEGGTDECWSAAEMLEPGQVSDAGFEILERQEDGTIQVWMSPAITLEEFDALELPPTWIKNQPRGVGGDGEGGGPDDGGFCGSPGSTDGEMVFAEHFGHQWAHVATIVEAGVPLDDEGLLLGNRIAKEHEITYHAGSTVPVIISPDGELYPLVSRDARRTTDESPIPAGWTVVDHTFTEDYTTRLPNPILNIRVENTDSYQGPVTGLEIEP